MSKTIRFLIILLVLLLAACNKPQAEPKGLPIDTEIPPVETSTTAPPLQVTDTPEPTSTETEPLPEEPTIDLTVVLEGSVIPLLPAGRKLTLYEIQMIDTKAGWAIGAADPDFDRVLRTSDGGLTWQDVTPPQPIIQGLGRMMLSGGFWDQNTAWVTDNYTNLIWATRDGGLTWQAFLVKLETGGGGVLFSILDENHVWAFQFLDAGMNHVYTAVNRSSDGGETWEQIIEPYTDISIQAFHKTGASFVNPMVGWLTRDFAGVQPQAHLNITDDGGVTWEALDIPPPPSVPDMFSGFNACGLYEPRLKSPQAGTMRLSCAYDKGDQTVYGDWYYLTGDGGATWEILDAPGGVIVTISDQILYSIGTNYEVERDIYRSEDGGNHWTKVRTVYWNGQFSFIDQDTAWAVAYDNQQGEYALVKTDDGCNSFEELKPVTITSQAKR